MELIQAQDDLLFWEQFLAVTNDDMNGSIPKLIRSLQQTIADALKGGETHAPEREQQREQES